MKKLGINGLPGGRSSTAACLEYLLAGGLWDAPSPELHGLGPQQEPQSENDPWESWDFAGRRWLLDH